MSLNVRLLHPWNWALGAVLAGCGGHVVVGGDPGPAGGPQSPTEHDSGWGAAGASTGGSNGDSGFGVAGWTASGGTRGVEMDAAATGGAGGGKGGADMDAVGTGGVGGGTGGTRMDAGFGTGGASPGRGGSSGEGGNAGTSGSPVDAAPPVEVDGSLLDAAPPVEDDTGPPRRPVPSACYQAGQGVAPTPDRAAVVNLLVGKWVLCGSSSVFGRTDDGIEFYADQSWANLIRTPSGTYEPGVGPDNRGKWEVLAVPVSGPASYQLTIAKDGGGGVYVFPSFTTVPRKMSLQGIFVSHYAAP